MLRSFDDKHFSDGLSPATIEEINKPTFTDQDQFVSVSILIVCVCVCVCVCVLCIM